MKICQKNGWCWLNIGILSESGIHGLKSGRQGRRPDHERSKTGLPASRGVSKYPMNNCVISSLV
jgi:hypothetical protein